MASAGNSTTTPTRTAIVSGQLKSNVQSRLDYLSNVFLSLSELVAKYDAENGAFKEFIAILLHFKYMLQFLRGNLLRDEELFRRLGPDAAILFKADLKLCLAKFNTAVASSACLDFVKGMTDYYRAAGTTTYCSFAEDAESAPVMPPAPKRGRFSGGSNTGEGGVFPSAYSRSAPNHAPNTSASSSSSTNAEFNTSAAFCSSDREGLDNASEHSEHLEIKLEPDVEIIEPPLHLRGGFDGGELSDDSCSRTTTEGGGGGGGRNGSNLMLSAMLDKPITGNPSSSSSTTATSSSSAAALNQHRMVTTRDRNNDLKLVLRKVVKGGRSSGGMAAAQGFSQEEEEAGGPHSGVTTTTSPPSNSSDINKSSTSGSNSNNNIGSSSNSKAAAEYGSSALQLYQRRLPRVAKSNVQSYAVLEREHSREEDYDFDYEKEDYVFEGEEEDEDEEEGGEGRGAAYSGPTSYNADGQISCPTSGCSLYFDDEEQLSLHLKVAHFTNLDYNTTFCLVEGCTERFPNSARATLHMKNVHPEEYITCEQCQKQVKAHYMRKHYYMRHRRGTYRCSQDCDYVAAYYHELEKHRYMTHNNRGYGWADYGGGGGGGSAPISSISSVSATQNSSASTSNVFFPSNPIAAAVMANHNQQNSSNSNSNGSAGFNHLEQSLGEQPSAAVAAAAAAALLRQPATTSTAANSTRRYLCKYPDTSTGTCTYWHEARSRVLQHIRTSHLSGGRPSTSSSSTAASSSSSSSQKNGGSLVLDDRAVEYLEVYDF